MSNIQGGAPADEPENTISRSNRAMASAIKVMRIAGVAMLLYWGLHLIQHFRYWDLYQRQIVSDANLFLGPYYRAFIDVAAIAAGILMIAKSKWALLPLALHFVGYLLFIASIMQGNFYWRLYPASIFITLIADVLLLALLLLLEARRKLGLWPLRARA